MLARSFGPFWPSIPELIQICFPSRQNWLKLGLSKGWRGPSRGRKPQTFAFYSWSNILFMYLVLIQWYLGKFFFGFLTKYLNCTPEADTTTQTFVKIQQILNQVIIQYWSLKKRRAVSALASPICYLDILTFLWYFMVK